MKVFLSWSGPRSRAVADTLDSWLPNVIQVVEPWVSTHSIQKGARGLEEISSALEVMRFGLICLTSENLNANWIHFEAGALSKTRNPLWTFLLDVGWTDVQPPLGMFQHTAATDKDDVRKLLTSINEEVGKSGERALNERQLDTAFTHYWPELEAALLEIRNRQPSADTMRSEREMLEELVMVQRTHLDALDEALMQALTRTPSHYAFIAENLKEIQLLLHQLPRDLKRAMSEELPPSASGFIPKLSERGDPSVPPNIRLGVGDVTHRGKVWIGHLSGPIDIIRAALASTKVEEHATVTFTERGGSVQVRLEFPGELYREELIPLVNGSSLLTDIRKWYPEQIVLERAQEYERRRGQEE